MQNYSLYFSLFIVARNLNGRVHGLGFCNKLRLGEKIVETTMD